MALISSTVYGGAQQYLRMTNPAGSPADVRASHTIMCRVKYTATTSGNRYDACDYLAVADLTGSFLGKATGTTTVSRGGRQNTGATFQGVTAAGTTVDTTTWRHIALVYDATGALITYYINGTSVGTQASATTYVSSGTGTNLGIYAGIFAGKTADFAVFNRALSAGEVANMAAYRVPQVTSGLVAFYRFDTNSTGGTTSGPALDSSGNGNTLTVQQTGGTAISYSTADNPPQPEDHNDLAGAPASSSAFAGTLTNTKPLAGAAASSSALSGAATALVKGNAASASAFAGAMRAAISGAAASSSALAAWIRPRWGRRVEVSSALYFVPSAFATNAPWTVMTWLRCVSLPNSGDSVQLFAPSAGGSAVFQLYCGHVAGTPRIRAAFTDEAASVRINYTRATSDTTWHHLAMTFDGVSTVTLFLDGSQVATDSAVTTAATSWSTTQFSRTGAGVAEFAHTKIWTAALSPTEIVAEKDFYNAFNQLAALYAAYRLSWQNVTLDDSGNGRTLTDNGSTEAQSEAPGAFMTLIAGSASSTSALAGSLSTTKPITGALASSSSFAAAVTALLTGPTASSSALAGQLTALLSGSAASTSVLSGTLTARIAAAAASSSSLAGALQALLAGAAASSSAFSGTLGLSGLFAGNTATSSTFNNPTLNVNAGVTGSLATSSALAGTLQSLLTGNATSVSAFAGALTARLTGTALATTSAFQGALTAQIAGNAASASLLAGVLKLTHGLAGIVASASSFSGSLTTAVQLQFAGNAATQSLFNGALSVTQLAAAYGGNTYTNGSVSPVYYSDATPGPLLPHRSWPPRPR